MVLRTPRWRDILDRPRKLWGRVESVNPLVISHAGSVLSDVVPDDSMVPDLARGDRIRYELENNALTIEGRVSRNWSYEVPTAGPGWVTVAEFPGNGRAAGTFTLMNSSSGEHDMLLFDFQVAYSHASIQLRSYSPYGRGSPGIRTMRYLTSSADSTYGPGILQVYLAEPLAGWFVHCEQVSSPILRALKPGYFSSSTSGYDDAAPASQCGVYPTDREAATLQNGWFQYSTGWSRPHIYMLPGSEMVVGGMVNASSRTSTTIMTLPVGCRPRDRTIFTVRQNNASTPLGRVDVNTDGTVVYQDSSLTPSWIVLDGIHFPAYQ